MYCWSRLHPLTIGVSKQLMPVYDKPVTEHHPLSTLMLAGIREILIITTAEDQSAFQRVLGDGSRFGVNLSYTVQSAPDGLAQAFVLAEEFLAGSPPRWCSATTCSTATAWVSATRFRDLEGAAVFGDLGEGSQRLRRRRDGGERQSGLPRGEAGPAPLQSRRTRPVLRTTSMVVERSKAVPHREANSDHRPTGTHRG